MSDVLVVGLGNPLMSDEGVGVRLARILSERTDGAAGVEVLELGTPGLALLHVVRNRRKVVLVDCALMGEPPGAIRRFTPDEVRSAEPPGGLSLHRQDALATLELARRLGEAPDEVIIFGIQPARVEPGEGLSPALEARLEDYLDAIAAELPGRRPTEPTAEAAEDAENDPTARRP